MTSCTRLNTRTSTSVTCLIRIKEQIHNEVNLREVSHGIGSRTQVSYSQNGHPFHEQHQSLTSDRIAMSRTITFFNQQMLKIMKMSRTHYLLGWDPLIKLTIHVKFPRKSRLLYLQDIWYSYTIQNANKNL